MTLSNKMYAMIKQLCVEYSHPSYAMIIESLQWVWLNPYQRINDYRLITAIFNG